MKTNQTGSGFHRDSRREARASKSEAERIAIEEQLEYCDEGWSVDDQAH